MRLTFEDVIWKKIQTALLELYSLLAKTHTNSLGRITSGGKQHGQKILNDDFCLITRSTTLWKNEKCSRLWLVGRTSAVSENTRSSD